MTDPQWPVTSDGYVKCEEVGRGGSATVWRGNCLPLNCEVAIKVCFQNFDFLFSIETLDFIIAFRIFVKTHKTKQTIYIIQSYIIFIILNILYFCEKKKKTLLNRFFIR